MGIRTPCCVPHCQRSTRAEHSEWLCSVHWPMTGRALRRRYFRLRRFYRDVRRPLKERQRAFRLGRAIWDRLKIQAIERAVGL